MKALYANVPDAKAAGSRAYKRSRKRKAKK